MYIVYSMYVSANCSKMLIIGIINYSDAKNIVSVINNVIISSELQ